MIGFLLSGHYLERILPEMRRNHKDQPGQPQEKNGKLLFEERANGERIHKIPVAESLIMDLCGREGNYSIDDSVEHFSYDCQRLV
jgi:hypothetical protein